MMPDFDSPKGYYYVERKNPSNYGFKPNQSEKYKREDLLYGVFKGKIKMILMIDNYDSFTYNIVQYCLELGANLKVIRNDEMSVKEIEALNPEKIIISPGPATPNEAGICLEVIDFFCR